MSSSIEQAAATDAAASRPARWAAYAMFAVDGLGFGPWAAHLPAFKVSLGLSDGGLSVPLFAMVIGSLVAMPIAGRLTFRLGSRRVLLIAATQYSASVSLIALTVTLGAGLAAFTVAAFLFGAVKATIDVSANAQAVGIERETSRPILSRCHGCWSLGSLIGAGGAALALRFGSPPLLTMCLTSLLLLTLTVASAPCLRSSDEMKSSDAPTASKGSLWPTGRLLPLGILAFLGLFCEGSVADWSAVYLAGHVGVPAASAALGFAAYMTAMTLTRFLGDRLIGRLGPAAVLKSGGLLVAIGLGGALLARSLPLAMTGFALAGIGLANAVPVIFRSAGTGHDPGGAIASVSTLGYLGFLAGPPVIGLLAEAVGLPFALLLVVAFGLTIAVAAGTALGSANERETSQQTATAPTQLIRREGGDYDPRTKDTKPMGETTFPYVLAAIDIDDTLVGHDKRIGRANRNAVKRLRDLGCRVILASGRRHANMLPYCEELQLDGYVVSSQGARVEPIVGGEVLYRAYLAPDVTSTLIVEGLARGYTVLLFLPEGVFAQTETKWVDAYRTESNDPVTIVDLSVLDGRCAEKVIWGGEPADIAVTRDEEAARYEEQLSVVVTSDWSLEFAAFDANKAAGVAAVASAIGVPREQVIAFGDGNNDVPLLEWAGLGVAMPHGRRAAHEAADLIGPDGDPESALARAVDSIVARY